MLVIPLNFHLAFICIGLAFIVEFFRIVLAYTLARPSSEIRKLSEEKALANLEIVGIKSIQLELVKHSLLTRKVIKIEKRIEKLQEETKGRFKRVKSFSRATTLAVYLPFCIYFFYANVVAVDPKLVWPVSMFLSSKPLSVPVWLLLGSAALASRHLLRTLLLVIFRGTEFA